MPASIRIESGIAAGTSYWIDRAVLRVGSDPGCEICLPMAELAAHALTIEFRDRTYRAYNRAAEPISVGRVTIKPASAGVWNVGETVQLPGDVRLVLEVDGDPRPCSRPEARIDDTYAVEDPSAMLEAAGDTAEAAAKKKSSTMMQLAIIGFCVLATAAFLTMGRGGEAAAPNRPTFESIVETELAKTDDTSRARLQRLQYAQAAIVRGNNSQARDRFLKLRDLLVRQVESLPKDGRDDVQRMLDYVEYRLGQLQ